MKTLTRLMLNCQIPKLPKQRSRIYELNIAEINERHRREKKELAEKLTKSGMFRQGLGYSAFADLALKQIKESAIIYADSLLSTLDENKIVDKRTEQKLIGTVESFLDRLVAIEKMSVSSRLAADNITGALADHELSTIPRRSLDIRQYLRNKISVAVDNHNLKVRTTLSSFWQTVRGEFSKTIVQKFASLIWILILVAVSFLLGWLVRGCEN